jgi:DNA-binding winged helix-turn-helix (wHTH) protein
METTAQHLPTTVWQERPQNSNVVSPHRIFQIRDCLQRNNKLENYFNARTEVLISP